ncbi:MAG: glutamate racemase [Oscillospiraceae bacterium]|nr:glutamate racemase [Oscillospiraceae bacterium]
MDNRPIGIFDTGLGGLTMVKALCGLLPGEDIIYLGDTGRVPYGSRSKETIIKYAGQNAAFLHGLDIKALVVACNTVCSVAFDEVKKPYSIPFYEVVKTPAKVAAQSTKNNKIGVIGTKATINSRAYELAIHSCSPEISVFSVPCPLFVPLVEEGWTDPDDEAAKLIVKRYLEGLAKENIDTLILGCTHYPLLTETIKKVMGESVRLVDSAAETAGFIASDLKEKALLKGDADSQPKGSVQYYVTDCTKSFAAHASNFLKSDISNLVKKITVE